MKLIRLVSTIIIVLTLFENIHSQEACGKRRVCKCWKTSRKYIVNCSNRSLSVIPANIPNYVTDLYLQNNNIRNLSKSVFWKCREIRKLDISDNKLERIPGGIFVNNTWLQHLFLTNLSMKDLPEDVFRNNKHLQRVDLSFNNLEVIHGETFENNTRLDSVYLRHNNITGLPQNVFWNIKALRRIDLSYNSLTSIPEEIFQRNDKLESINLYSNRLSLFGNGTFTNNVNLQHIYLDYNKLEYLPEKLLENCPKLIDIVITNNKLRAIPETIFTHNRNLRTIIMRHNFLETLPSDVVINATFLNTFDVSFNNLSTISQDIFKYSTNLKFLYLMGNKIQRIPDLLFQTTRNLITLYLGRNNISEIQSNVFENLEGLKTLDLSFNNFKAIPNDIVARNVKLEKIFLSHNSLETVPYGLFKNLSNLKKVDLSFNQLARLPRDLFSSNFELQDLYFTQNHLNELPKDMLKSSVKLQNITLAYNMLESLDVNLFATTTNLEGLDITGNRLKKLPGELLTSTPKLKRLRLCSNEIDVIPEKLFASVRGLEHWTICKNKLTAINKTTLEGSDQLYYLSLYGNMLSSLPMDLFSNVTLHGIVFLSDNYISEIPTGLFCSNRCSHKLEWLFLHNNNLSYLPKNCFKGLPKLKHVFLNNNKITAMADDVFRGTSVENVYIFSNNLRTISNESLRNDYIREIHLYKNPIEMVLEKAFSARRGALKLYVQCDELVQIPWFSKNISSTCLKNKLPPTINIMGIGKRSIRATLIEDGFNCTPGEWKPKCSPCPPGSYGDSVSGCLPCPAGGFYQDDFGRLKCKTCNNGTFVNHSEGKAIESCELCPEGTDLTRHAGHRACFCKMEYARTHRFEGCSLCLEKGLNCSQDYKSLKTGYYWNWSFPGANATAYFNFVFHLQNDSLQFNVSSKQYTYKIPKVHECPQQYSCENKGSVTAENITGNCKYGYRGWLCSKCQSRFYSILNICLPCPDKIWIILELIAIFLMGIGLYVFILWQNKRHEKINRNERSLVDKISSQMKIVLGFYQVVGELFESFHDITWVGPLKLLGELIAFLKINVLRVIIRPHCYSEKLKINAKIQFIISLSFPVVMFVFFVSFYHIWKLYLKYRFRNAIIHVKEKLRNLREKLYTYSLLLLFITYPPTCDVIFKLYPGACKTFYIYGEDTTVNITLLRSDFDLDCGKLKFYQIFAYVATVIYVALFPCALLLLLRKYRMKVIVDEIEDGNVNSTENQSEGTASERSHLINGKSDESDIPIWIKFLCENYKPRFWYWEIIELARKVTQTVLVTLLGFEDALTKLLTIGISVLFLTLHAKLSPMTSHFEQRLQMFSLTAIFINVLIASVPIPQDYQAPISTILILMNMIIILVIAGEVMLFIIRFIKRNIAQCKKK